MPLTESRRPFQHTNDEETVGSGSQHNQKAMFEACESGDVPGLQQLLRACHVRDGDAPVDPKYGEPDPPQSAPPPTWKLLTAAIGHGQFPIVTLLLKTYPTVDLNRQSILEATLAKPHLETFKLLHAHSPSIIDFEFDSQNTSLLMETCRGGHPMLPNYLLDNGADPNEGGFPGVGPLFYAVKFEQPLKIIVKMVDRGALVTNAVLTEAIRKQRTTIIEFLLKRGGLKDSQRALESAHETGNKEIITLIAGQAEKDLKDADVPM